MNAAEKMIRLGLPALVVAVMATLPAHAGTKKTLTSLTCIGETYQLINTGKRGLFGGTAYQVRHDGGRLEEVFSHTSDKKAVDRFESRFCNDLKRRIEDSRIDP